MCVIQWHSCIIVMLTFLRGTKIIDVQSVLHKAPHTCIYRVIQSDCWGTIIQRQFHTKFGKQPPSDNSIRRWYAQFQETGCMCFAELKVRIRTAIETITADMLQTVWNELDYSVDVCRIY